MPNAPQNSGATTVDIEAMLPSALTKADCGELTERNKDQQANKTKDGQLQEGQTSVTAHHQPEGGNPVFAGAITPQSAVASSASNSLCQAPAQKVLKGAGKGGKNKLSPPPNRPCSQEQFKFRRKGHGEAKIVQALFSQGMVPGTLTLNIDWRPTGADPRSVPCDDCHEMLCDATECGLKIQICSPGSKEPKPYKCP